MLRESGKKRWVHAASYWKLAFGASKGLVVRAFVHDADVLLGAIAR